MDKHPFPVSISGCRLTSAGMTSVLRLAFVLQSAHHQHFPAHHQTIHFEVSYALARPSARQSWLWFMLRADEMAFVDVEGVSTPVLLLRKSKTDQGGHGRVLARECVFRDQHSRGRPGLPI